MKLHYDPISTTSRPVMMLIHDARLPVELVEVSLFASAHQTPAFTALNPNQAVPVLELDDGFVLTEVSAILKFLAEQGRHGSYPADPLARARVNQMMDWFNTGFYRDFGYGMVYAQTLPHLIHANPTSQADVVRQGSQRAARWLTILNDHYLAKGPWLCGEEVTIADYLAGGYVSLGDWIGFDLSPWPNVARWMSALKATSAWAATHGPFEAFVAMLADQRKAA
ncbi:MAG TPA: glutathione S-transferase family protein [Caulobacter sp.]|nr:glutathione S-transferase family protein [Caulobacter sp.]